MLLFHRWGQIGVDSSLELPRRRKWREMRERKRAWPAAAATRKKWKEIAIKKVVQYQGERDESVNGRCSVRLAKSSHREMTKVESLIISELAHRGQEKLFFKQKSKLLCLTFDPISITSWKTRNLRFNYLVPNEKHHGLESVSWLLFNVSGLQHMWNE